MELIRIRNPWGKETGQWTGAWAKGSPEWSRLAEPTRGKLLADIERDGEFWMDIKDYYKCIRDTHICSFTPDFDKDGTTDGLGMYHFCTHYIGI